MKSEIWDSKIWSWIPRDWDLRMNALARARSNCKRQTHPLVRESAPHQQTRNCLIVIQIWPWAPAGCFIPRETGRLTVGRNIRLRLSGLIHSFSRIAFGRVPDDWELSRRWRINFVFYLQDVIIICSYDLWVSNKSIHQSKPCLQVNKVA
jgi:hypothetical protein